MLDAGLSQNNQWPSVTKTAQNTILSGWAIRTTPSPSPSPSAQAGAIIPGVSPDGVMQPCTPSHTVGLTTPRPSVAAGSSAADWSSLADFADLYRNKELLGVTVSGRYVGTPPYTAPETSFAPGAAYLRGFTSTRSDIYSLGVTLAEVLSGVPAPRVPVDAERARRSKGATLPSAAELRSHQPRLVDLFDATDASSSQTTIQSAAIHADLQVALKRMLHLDVRQRPPLAEVADIARQILQSKSSSSAVSGNRRVRAAAFSDERVSSDDEQESSKRARTADGGSNSYWAKF